jgi:hypothetical protein
MPLIITIGIKVMQPTGSSTSMANQGSVCGEGIFRIDFGFLLNSSITRGDRMLSMEFLKPIDTNPRENL